MPIASRSPIEVTVTLSTLATCWSSPVGDAAAAESSSQRELCSRRRRFRSHMWIADDFVIVTSALFHGDVLERCRSRCASAKSERRRNTDDSGKDRHAAPRIRTSLGSQKNDGKPMRSFIPGYMMRCEEDVVVFVFGR